MRRLGALIGIVVVVGLALALIWRVWLHHGRMHQQDDTPVVSIAASANAA